MSEIMPMAEIDPLDADEPPPKEEVEDLELGDVPLSEEAASYRAKSLTELGWLSDRMENRLSAAEADLIAAEKQFAGRTQRTNFRSDASAAAATAEHLDDLAQAVQAVRTVADEVYQSARNMQDATASGREMGLSEDDMARANNRQVFVKEDALELPLPVLQARIEEAFAASDTASLWLYRRYTTQRLQAGHEADNRSAARQNVVKLIENINSRLTDRRTAGANERAKKLQKAALDLKYRPIEGMTARPPRQAEVTSRYSF